MSIILDGTTGVTFPNGVTMADGTSSPVTAAQGGTGLSSVGTAGNTLFTTNGTTWSSTAKIVQATPQASTSGTSIDFTGIPSWVKKITLILNQVSTNGTNDIIVRVGTSGGIVSTGYVSTTGRLGGSGTANYVYTDAFPAAPLVIATYTFTGTVTIYNYSGNTWIASALTVPSVTGGNMAIGSGSVTLSGTLDRVRLTTVGSIDTFDSGSVNILYE